LDESPPDCFENREFNMVCYYFVNNKKLKMLVTEDSVRTEQKYKTEKEVANFCNVFVGSNYSTTQFPFFENVPGSESSTSGRRYSRLIFIIF
jgi:hypothetical protein